MGVNFLSENDAEEWNNFVENASHTSSYHMWEWGEALYFTYGYQRYYLSSVQEERVLGILPLIHVKSMFFGNRLISLPFCEYGGPLLVPELSTREKRQVTTVLLNAANKLAKTLRVNYIEMRNPVIEDAEELVEAQGYAVLPRYVTFRVDLTRDSDELWANLDKSTRKSIRKAMKNQVTVREVEGEEQLKAFYTLYLKDMRKHGSPPHKYLLFKKFSELFQASSKMRILLAEYEGRFIGGRIVFCDGKTIFCWSSVSDTKYRNLNPSILLLWETIEWGLKNGYHSLEMGRTRKGTTIYDFKKSWGGREINLNEYICFTESNKRELPDPTERTYRYLAKVWSLMPIGLAKRIGPKILSGIAL
jgi:FemAB-related protein (PEP-CTERM system-associated)